MKKKHIQEKEGNVAVCGENKYAGTPHEAGGQFEKGGHPVEAPEVDSSGAPDKEEGRKVITVSQDGDGDYDSPKKAYKTARPGNTIRIRKGLYLEKINITTPDLIIEGEPGVEIVSDDDDYTIRVNTESCTLRNLRLQNFSEDMDCAVLDIMSGRAMIEDCEITGGYMGISIRGKAKPMLRNNKIHESRVGISAHDGGEGTIEDNYIYRNHATGIIVKGGGNPTIHRNRFLANGTGVMVLDSGMGIVKDNDISMSDGAGILVLKGGSARIEYNRICFGETGIAVYSSDGVLIEGNDVFENGGTGIDVHAGAAPVIRGNRITLNKEGVCERACADSEIEGNYFDNNSRGNYITIEGCC